MHLFWIGRCPVKGCKHAERHEDVVNAQTFGHCPDHGVYRLERGGGYVSEKKCGARCLNAVGPSCDCACGGHNHGMGHMDQPISRTCVKCGQMTLTSADPLCEPCKARALEPQGEPMRLFVPAPAQTRGQMYF